MSVCASRLVRFSGQRSFSSLNVAHKRTMRWVPEAYRGAKKPETPRKKINRKSLGLRQETPTWKERRASKASMREMAKKKQDEIKFVGLFSDLIRLSRDYRSFFSSEPLEEDALPAFTDPQKWSAIEDNVNDKRIVLKKMKDQIQLAFKEIHLADEPVEWKQIEKSEDHYRSLCRLLQAIIKVSTSLAEYNKKMIEFVDIAEKCLRELDTFSSDRALVARSSKKWNTREENEKSQQFSLFRIMFEAVSSLEGTAPVNMPTMAHDDLSLGSTQDLYRLVMQAIMATCVDETGALINVEGTDQRSSDESDQNQYFARAKRMVDLLGSMPPDCLPDTDIIEMVLDVLRRVGTLESAQECERIFCKDPANLHRLRFTLILQAYLEAARNETGQRRMNAVQGALSAFQRQWNEKVPRHRVERITHGSLVLECLTVVDPKSMPDICDETEGVIRRTLGNGPYAKFLEDIEMEKPSFDHQLIPIVNSRARIFALSGDATRLAVAKRMVRQLSLFHEEKAGSVHQYPTVDTYNDLFYGIYYHCSKLPAAERAKSMKDEVQYTMSELDVILSSGNKLVWPNNQTFTIILSLLAAWDDSSIGDLGEQILSKMEIRQSFVHNDVRITLAIYHRVLRLWEQASDFLANSRAVDRCVAILDKLELQSSPLLLTSRDFFRIGYPRLYNFELAPTDSTYNLVLNVCAKSPDDHERVAAIALQVATRMRQRGLVHSPDTPILLRKCCDRLSLESEHRKRLEHFIETLQNENTPPALG